jgi:hypothetical protein
MRLFMCDFVVLGSEDELEWEVARLEAAPLPPPSSSPLLIGDPLRYTPRGDCLSIVQVLVSSIKPPVLLLLRRLIVSMGKESRLVVWPRILDAEWLPLEEVLSACFRLELCSDFGCDATMRTGYCEMRKATEL